MKASILHIQKDSKRKGPQISAKHPSLSTGDKRKGIDGMMWKVSETKTGIKRWQRTSPMKSPSQSKVKFLDIANIYARKYNSEPPFDKEYKVFVTEQIKKAKLKNGDIVYIGFNSNSQEPGEGFGIVMYNIGMNLPNKTRKLIKYSEVIETNVFSDSRTILKALRKIPNTRTDLLNNSQIDKLKKINYTKDTKLVQTLQNHNMWKLHLQLVDHYGINES